MTNENPSEKITSSESSNSESGTENTRNQQNHQSISHSSGNGNNEDNGNDSDNIGSHSSMENQNLFFTNLNATRGYHHILNLICQILLEYNFRIEVLDCDSPNDISNVKDYIELKLKHEKSAMTFRMKILMITNNKLSISAYAEEDEDRVSSWNFSINDFLESSENWKLDFENRNWDALYANKRDEFKTALRYNIIRHLVPMGKEDITEEKGTQSMDDRTDTNRGLGIGGFDSREPHYRDPEFNPYRDDRTSGFPRYPPYGVGSDDLYPSGFGPRPFNGMFVGPNSSLFHPRGSGPPINPPGVPPGARYDPFGQEPDPDHFPMPGPPPRREPRQGRGSGGFGNSGFGSGGFGSGGGNGFPF